MGKSDRIEAFITELLKDCMDDDWLEIKRNELAALFGCVPSQINYVISTRFNSQRGYAVESKRGGGGCLRIRRINAAEDDPIYTVISEIGTMADYPSIKNYVGFLRDNKKLSDDCALMILSAASDNAIPLPQPKKDEVRAAIVKNMLLALI